MDCTINVSRLTTLSQFQHQPFDKANYCLADC